MSRAGGRNKTLTLRTNRPAAVMGRFERSVGGRERVSEVLSYTAEALPERLQRVAMLLEDPSAASLSLHNILATCGVSHAQWMTAWRKATVAEAQARAGLALAERMEAAAHDMADAAITHTRPCDCTVSASGPVPALAGCPTCQGRGVVTHRPDVADRRLFAEVTGLVKKGPAVAVQTNVTVPTGHSSFDALVKATDAVMDGLVLPPETA